MIRQSTMRPTLSAAVLSLTLAAAVTVSLLVMSAPARAADDDVPLDTKILRGIMESIGLRRDGEGINYQERAPLVIPPSSTLPPPEKSDTVIANNPAWPKDPDVRRAKEEAAAERASQGGFASDKINKEQSVLRGNDMTPGPKPRRTAKTNTGSNWSNDDPRLKPDELGYKGGFFSNIFGSKDEAAAKFTGEPPRAALTAPPPGYQTPSPEQPYGLSGKETAPKATDYMTTHGEGEK
jgi:hypothetical protein